jgi:hypothetical protein
MEQTGDALRQSLQMPAGHKPDLFVLEAEEMDQKQ